MYSTIYTIVTPFGSFKITWDDEDNPATFSGNEGAIAYFHDLFTMRSIFGMRGKLLSAHNIEPIDVEAAFNEDNGMGIVLFVDKETFIEGIIQKMVEGGDMTTLDPTNNEALIAGGLQIIERLDDSKSPTFFQDLEKLQAIIKMMK